MIQKKIPSRGFKYGPGKKYGADPNRPKTRSRLKRCMRERGFSSKYYARYPVSHTHTNEENFPCPTLSATKRKERSNHPQKGLLFMVILMVFGREQYSYQHRQRVALFGKLLSHFSFSVFSAFKQNIMYFHYQCELYSRWNKKKIERVIFVKNSKANRRKKNLLLYLMSGVG